MPNRPDDGPYRAPRDVPERGLMLAIIVLFALSRLGLWAFGLAPNPAWVLNHLQNADITLLTQAPLQTVWYMHSQPPLWNLILGAAAVLGQGDPAVIATIILGVHMAISMAVILMINAILRRLRVGFGLRALAAGAQLGMPWVLFFENYVFYQHSTYGLLTLFLWGWLAFLQDQRHWQSWLAFGAFALLSWVWSVFHPVMLVLLLVGLLVAGRGIRWSRLVLPAAAALGLAILPSVKNAYVFDNPSSSSWLGLNLMKTVTWTPEEDRQNCTFQDAWAHAETAPADPTLPDLEILTAARKTTGHPNGHHLSVIDYSNRCMDVAVDLIRDNPMAYIKGRAWQIFRSYSTPSYIYGWAPLNWDRMTLFTAPYETSRSPIKFIGIGILFAIWLALFWLAVRRGSHQAFYLSCFIIAGVFTGVTLLLNGVEQHRMRYSISQIQLIVALVVLQGLIERIGRRR